MQNFQDTFETRTQSFITLLQFAWLCLENAHFTTSGRLPMISWVTNVLTKLQTDKAKRSLESVSNLTPLFCSKYSDLLFQVTRNNIQYFRQPNNSSSNKRQSHWWLRMFDHPQYVQFYSFCMLKKNKIISCCEFAAQKLLKYE